MMRSALNQQSHCYSWQLTLLSVRKWFPTERKRSPQVPIRDEDEFGVTFC
jgi:hypothetical protein